MNKKKVLIIDDESTIGLSCKRVLENENFIAVYYENAKKGLKEALTNNYDLILLDLLLPEIEGMEILKILKSKKVNAEIIIMTGYGTVESAVEAIKTGAADYINKPFSPDELLIRINKIIKHSDTEKENIALKNELNINQGFEGIIGKNASILEIFSVIKRISQTDCNVLITGESGTGKELIAQAIHRTSLRKDKSFIACDCSSLTSTLLESELFGHVKGSFSGAISSKQGLFEIASKGTLFLDEISNISTEIQSKLLRVLETRKLRRVGDTEERSIDIRLITASNQNLVKKIEEGAFREDLFYRLQVIPIHLPPLRERSEDIVTLANFFLSNIKRKINIKAHYFSPEAIRVLEDYKWTGNIRELKNVIERVAILCDREVIKAKHLPNEIKRVSSSAIQYNLPESWENFKKFKLKIQKDTISKIEEQYLISILEKTNGNVSKASKMIGMQRTNFHSLLKKNNIKYKKSE